MKDTYETMTQHAFNLRKVASIFSCFRPRFIMFPPHAIMLTITYSLGY